MEGLKSGVVTTVCYGKEEQWDDRAEAARSFLNAMMNSEGSERERYSNVYFEIIQGLNCCTDSERD